MSEMIERVAVAVRSAFTDAELNNPRISFKELTDILARAALEAMRVPTQEMIDSCGNGECAKWAPGAWANYIDAALSNAKQKAQT